MFPVSKYKLRFWVLWVAMFWGLIAVSVCHGASLGVVVVFLGSSVFACPAVGVGSDHTGATLQGTVEVAGHQLLAFTPYVDATRNNEIRTTEGGGSGLSA